MKKNKKKVEYSFTTYKAEFPPESVKKNLIKFSKKFHKEVENISFNLPKGSLMIVEEEEIEEIKEKAEAMKRRLGK